MKVWELARELGVPSRAAIATLRVLGVDVRSAAHEVGEQDARRLRDTGVPVAPVEFAPLIEADSTPKTLTELGLCWPNICPPRMRKQFEHYEGTATDVATALKILSMDGLTIVPQVPATTIRSWANRGKIEQLPGRRYRIGDVVHCSLEGDLRASRHSMA